MLTVVVVPGDHTLCVPHAPFVKELLRSRRLRLKMIGPDIFGEPAYDILLDLYAAHLDRGEVSVSSSCIAAGVPATTALRAIGDLQKRGLVLKKRDPDDRRRTFLRLSPDGLDRIAKWVGHVIEMLSSTGLAMLERK